MGSKVGYYRQDFSTLNFEDTIFDALCLLWINILNKKCDLSLQAF